ncbi:MAG: polyphosphate kinase 1, partial [Varibaculum cambriense]|nr:polyphosphate kinase 1 [Varibaculum cambriense]
MDSKQEADNKPEPKVGKAKIKEDAQGDSHVVPSPADIARMYKENPQTEPVAQVDRQAAQSNFETATADELISSKTSPEQFPGTDYEDADYDLPTGASPFVDGRKINTEGDQSARPEITIASSSDKTANKAADSKDSEAVASEVKDDTAGHAQTDGPEDLSQISPSTLREAPGMDKLAQAGPLGQDKPLPKGRFGDRELSWMQFNQRVLEQAEDERLPILERAWFTTIFSSNLDEFYMVRVAGLKRRIAAGIARTAASGLTPRQVLDLVTERAQVLCARQADFVQNTLLGELENVGIKLRRWNDLSPEQQDFLHGYFRRQIFPILTPLAVDPSHPFPYISGLSVNLAVVVRNPLTGKQHFARVKIPESLPRLICVEQAIDQVSPEDAIDTNGEATFISLEDVIGPHLDHLFPGMEILEHHVFRLTRNEDLEVEEDDAENLLTAMEQELLRRRFGPAVRLEVAEGISRPVLDFLVAKLEIGMEDVFALPEPIDLRCLNELHELDLPELKYQKFVPATAAGLAEVESATPTDIFAMIRSHDVLLHHPYDSFSTSVQHFVTYAARDPKVRSLKQTLYRTSSDSPIVSALIEAAQNGKQVLAIVEIKARFDEDANISWARKLERAGVHVVYGMVGLKTHCKLSMVVREEADGLRRYCHVGTGNYHPKTARGYEDLGLLTCDREVAQDLTRLFNQLSGYAPRTSFHRLLVAPRSIRPGIIERIEREV